MRVFLIAFIVFFMLYFEKEVVCGAEYSATEEQIRIEGLDDGWSIGQDIKISVNITENISYIMISMKRNGVYYTEKTIGLNEQSSSYTFNYSLGDGTSGYEGITDWLVSVMDGSGNLYRCHFQAKMDSTAPVIKTDIFGDYGYDVLFDNRKRVHIWAEDEVSEVYLLRVNPSNYQNLYVNGKITPVMRDGNYSMNYQYPNGDEYGYVIMAVDLAGNISTRVIITRYNVTSKMKRIIPRGNYD